MTRRRLVAPLALLAAWASPLEARGDDPAVHDATAARDATPATGRGVAVELASCFPPSLRGEIVAALRVELREIAADVVEHDPATRGDRALLSVGPLCDPAHLDLRARLGPGDVVPNAERVLDLERTADPERPRVLAIALAELLHAAVADPSQSAAASAGPPRALRAPATPVTTSEAPPPDAAPTVRFLGGGVARARFGRGAVQLGPRVDVRIRVTSFVDAVVGAAVLLASDRTPLGDVDATVPLGRFGLSAAHRAERLSVDGGVFGELGAAQISATPGRDDVVARDASGLAAATGVDAGAEILVVGPLRVRSELEVGLVLAHVEARANGRPAPGYGGAFIGLALQVGAGF